MVRKEFQEKFGNEPIGVTSNFVAKSISTNYDIADAFKEFCDNAYDARIKGVNLNINITIDRVNHTVLVEDDGVGIQNMENLLKLGASDKETRDDAIGKYGIGTSGAISAIAKQCVYNKDELVVITFGSASNGKYHEKRTCFDNDDCQFVGKTESSECDKNEHYTIIKIDNVYLKDGDCEKICSELEKTFEETFKKGLSINLTVDSNTRILGQSNVGTFVGDEVPKTIKVGDIEVEVKWRIIGDNSKDDRKFENSGLRFYDKESGRLLGQSTLYWKWFSGKEAQQNICGLRCGVAIPSTQKSYETFGIKAAKNGISHKLYHKQQIYFELRDELKTIYTKASNNKPKDEVSNISCEGIEFIQTSSKMSKPYSITFDEDGVRRVVYNKNLKPINYIELIRENIALRDKIQSYEEKYAS